MWYSMYMHGKNACMDSAEAEGLPIYISSSDIQTAHARTPGLYINIRMVIKSSSPLNTVPRLLYSPPRPIIMPMHKGRVWFLVCAVLLAASLAVYSVNICESAHAGDKINYPGVKISLE